MKTYKRKFGRVKPIAIFDIETVGLGGDFIIGAYVTEDDREVKFFNNIHDFMLEIVLTEWGRKYDWYAHNGAKYDYLYIIPRGLRLRILNEGFEIQPVMSRDTCKGLKIFKGGHCWRLKDSYALTGVSLDKFTTIFNVEHKKLSGSIDWATETFNPNMESHIAYLRNDVLGLLESIIAYQSLLRENFGTCLTWTTAGTSVRAWMDTVKPNNNFTMLSRDTEEFIRKCYHGGLNLIRWSKPFEHCYYYDINSSYAYSMMRGVPVGKPQYVETYRQDEPGFYRTFADSQQSNIPCMPYQNGWSVVYPLGKFWGYATSTEIDFARAMGWDIRIAWGIVFPEGIGYPYSEFISRCIELRMQDYSGPRGMLAKNLQNNLYGKFAQQREQQFYALTLEEPQPLKDNPWFLDYQFEEREDLWENTVESQSDMHMIHWAAWITADARIRLLRSCVEIGWENVLYCDTDSIVTRGEAINLDRGGDYGQWKEVHADFLFYPIAAKTYLGIGNDGDLTVLACKGIPRNKVTPQLLHEAFEGKHNAVTFTSTHSLMAVVRGKPISEIIHRTIPRPFSATGFNYNSETREFEPYRLDQSPSVPKDYSGTEPVRKSNSNQKSHFARPQIGISGGSRNVPRRSTI